MTTATCGKKGTVKQPPTINAQLMERIKKLPGDVLADLVELVTLLAESDSDEEKSEIAKTMSEILYPKTSWGIPQVSHTVDEEKAAKKALDLWRRKVGREIASLRKEKSWTQHQLAEKAGLPQSHICRLETGKHVPTHLTLKKVAKALGVAAGRLDPGFDD